MKKIILILVGFFITVTINAQNVPDYGSYVNTIKDNNSAIKALKLTFESQKVSNKIGNTPSDPTFEVNPSFNGDIAFTASIDFLFPTIYHQTKKMARMSTQKNQYEFFVALYKELLLIDQTYLKAIYINKKLELLRDVYVANEDVKDHFTASLEQGAASVLDLNTATGELLKSLSAISEEELEHDNLSSILKALNGGESIDIVSNKYPIFNIGSIDSYVERAMANSYDIQITKADSMVAVQMIKLSKQSWVPTLSLGYGYNLNPGARATDIANASLTISLPRWQNSHKVRAARLEYSAALERNKQARLNIESNLVVLKNGLIMAQENYKLHRNYFASSSSIDLLEKALKERKISVIDYYSEINLIVEIQLKKFEYEYRIMTTIAQMHSLLY